MQLPSEPINYVEQLLPQLPAGSQQMMMPPRPPSSSSQRGMQSPPAQSILQDVNDISLKYCHSPHNQIHFKQLMNQVVPLTSANFLDYTSSFTWYTTYRQLLLTIYQEITTRDYLQSLQSIKEFSSLQFLLEFDLSRRATTQDKSMIQTKLEDVKNMIIRLSKVIQSPQTKMAMNDALSSRVSGSGGSGSKISNQYYTEFASVATEGAVDHSGLLANPIDQSPFHSTDAMYPHFVAMTDQPVINTQLPPLPPLYPSRPPVSPTPLYYQSQGGGGNQSNSKRIASRIKMSQLLQSPPPVGSRLAMERRPTDFTSLVEGVVDNGMAAFRWGDEEDPPPVIDDVMALVNSLPATKEEFISGGSSVVTSATDSGNKKRKKSNLSTPTPPRQGESLAMFDQAMANMCDNALLSPSKRLASGGGTNSSNKKQAIKYDLPKMQIELQQIQTILNRANDEISILFDESTSSLLSDEDRDKVGLALKNITLECRVFETIWSKLLEERNIPRIERDEILLPQTYSTLTTQTTTTSQSISSYEEQPYPHM